MTSLASSPASPGPSVAAASAESADEVRAEIGVIGGSGLYEFLDDHVTVDVATPFGAPSDPVVVGDVGGRRVAFITRHGKGHRFAPSQVNYRANLWALRAVGVRQVIAPCAVGSLRPDHGPGTLVVPDQIIDRTWGRAHTFYDVEGPVVHIGFADPYCPRGRAAALASAHRSGHAVADSGTLVVINGPRFSTSAESQMNQQVGGTIVGMTTMPEAALARELAMCFTSVAMVTDYDAGVDGGEAVTHEEVMRVFAHNVEDLKAVLRDTIAALPETEDDESATCACRRSLDGIRLPFPIPGR